MTTIEPLLFSGVGGFAIGAITGYALKKLLKILAVVVGLFIAGLAYLAYRNIISVNNEQLTNLATQTIQGINDTTTNVINQTAQHTTNGVTMSAPVVGIIGFIPGAILGFKHG